MIKNKNNHPEGCISEQFSYIPYLGTYPNNADVRGLSEICCLRR